MKTRRNLLTCCILLPGLASLLMLGGCPAAPEPPASGDVHAHGGDADDRDDHDHGQAETGEVHHDESDEDRHDEAAHDDRDEHVRLTDAQLQELGVEVVEARGGSISLTHELPGEIVFNPDGVAHVQPRVSGVVRQVRRSLGDLVDSGDVLAILDSRELAQSITAYLAALAKEKLAELNYSREERLYDDQISSERSYLEARQAFEEARIETTRTERELHALGLSEQEIAALPEMSDEEFTRYELRAPIAGMITERHLVRGEVAHAESDEPPFVIADLGSVWVNLTIYIRDQADIRTGQHVVVDAGDSDLIAEGVIDFISPSLQEATRTGTARIVIDNADGRWRPGLFVTGTVTVRDAEVDVIVPRTALQTIDGRTVVFVEEAPAEFAARPVETGVAENGHIQIMSGLAPGERYAATATLTLKTEMNRAALEHAGHVH